MRVLTLALAAGLALPAAALPLAALAQEAIPTAGGAQPKSAPAATADAPPIGDPDDWRDGPNRVGWGPCGPTRTDADGKPDTAAHGEVHVGVGTGGYRSIGGRVCKPIGDNAAVSIAIDQTQWSGGRRRWR